MTDQSSTQERCPTCKSSHPSVRLRMNLFDRATCADLFHRDQTEVEADRQGGSTRDDRIMAEMQAETDRLRRFRREVVRALGAPDGGEYLNDVLARIESLRSSYEQMERERDNWVRHHDADRATMDRLNAQSLKDRERIEELQRRVEQLECPDPMCHPDQPDSHIIAERTASLEQDRIDLMDTIVTQLEREEDLLTTARLPFTNWDPMPASVEQYRDLLRLIIRQALNTPDTPEPTIDHAAMVGDQDVTMLTSIPGDIPDMEDFHLLQRIRWGITSHVPDSRQIEEGHKALDVLTARLQRLHEQVKRDHEDYSATYDRLDIWRDKALQVEPMERELKDLRAFGDRMRTAMQEEIDRERALRRLAKSQLLTDRQRIKELTRLLEAWLNDQTGSPLSTPTRLALDKGTA